MMDRSSREAIEKLKDFLKWKGEHISTLQESQSVVRDELKSAVTTRISAQAGLKQCEDLIAKIELQISESPEDANVFESVLTEVRGRKDEFQKSLERIEKLVSNLKRTEVELQDQEESVRTFSASGGEKTTEAVELAVKLGETIAQSLARAQAVNAVGFLAVVTAACSVLLLNMDLQRFALPALLLVELLFAFHCLRFAKGIEFGENAYFLLTDLNEWVRLIEDEFEPIGYEREDIRSAAHALNRNSRPLLFERKSGLAFYFLTSVLVAFTPFVVHALK